ncbi:Zeatin O-glucosyltransferase [Euphorbia peplus]|nr:Zeatin O-glucosyltransferase [Euphorbia peplus]
MGVPLAAWPMLCLITELLKVGVFVREWECRMTLLMCSSIKNVVRRLMISEDRKWISKRARELGEKVRRSAAEGGNSWVELDSFIAHITR